MKQFLPILRKCPLFEGIEDGHLTKMLGCLGGRVVSFDKKYTVFSAGSPARRFCVVLSGAVQVVQVDYNGNRSILSEAGPGEMVLEAFACAEVRAIPVSVVAKEPCEVLLLDCAHILHTCANACGFHQQLIYNLMKNIATSTLRLHCRMDITSRRTTREKLMAYLDHASREAGSRTFHIPFDRQELADYLEVDRSGLSNEISKLRAEGVLESCKNKFTLL